MPQLKKLTPNLIVSNVEQSLAFYRDVLGFTVTVTVPDKGRFVFVTLENGPVVIFLNAADSAYAEYPALKDQPIGGSLTLFIELEHIGAVHEDLKDKARVVAPLDKKWYGMTEFAIADPDGYVITLAERTQ